MIGFVAAACGGDAGADRFPDEDVPPPIAERPLGEVADTSAIAPAQTGDTAAPADADAGASAADRPPGGAASGDAPADTPADEWARRTYRGEATASGAALVRAVRMARHEDFDRLVIEFEGGLPSWEVASPTGEIRTCGEGRVVDVGAPGVIAISLDPANAHTEDGESTLGTRAWSPGLPALRTLRLICDFEAHVGFAAGTAGALGYRAFALREPARLVVDVRQPGG